MSLSDSLRASAQWLNSSTAHYSFDVFDTVLARAVHPPEAVFWQTGEDVRDLLPAACTPHDFAKLRAAADRRADEWHGPHKTLNRIYEELHTTLPVSDAVLHRIKEAELAVEQAVLYPIPETQAAIQSLRAEGAPILFASDMYLPSAFLQACLHKHGLWHPGDTLLVSCEHGATKSTGLFATVHDHAQSESVVHVGNCPHADVRFARAAGLQAHHYTTANPTRYEHALSQSTAPRPAGLAQLAGAARYARLHTEASTSHEQALRTVAAGVLAPALVGFVAWTLQQAQARQIKRLYFTARDGYLLVPIAQRLASAMGIACEARYIYLSRAVLRAAQAPSPAVMQPAGTADLPTSAPTPRRLLLDYLQQEGLTDDQSSALVDIGWKGSIHRMLNNVLMEATSAMQPQPGFFFGLTNQQGAHADARHAYFFDAHRQAGFTRVLTPHTAIYTLMETFCTAAHGTTTGLTRVNGQVEPVLEPSWTRRMETWGFPVVEATLHAFVDGLLRFNSSFVLGDVRNAVARTLRLFWETPTRAEAEAWGAFPRELGEGTDRTARGLAKPYPWSAVPRFVWKGPAAHDQFSHRFSWSQGALARSPVGVQRLIRGALHIRTLAKKVLRRLPGRW